MEKLRKLAMPWPNHLAEVRVHQCPEHGPYESRKMVICETETWTLCPACFEAEWQKNVRDIWRKNVRDLAARRAVALTNAAMETAAIPIRFADRTLANYHAVRTEQQLALQAARLYADQFAEAVALGRSLLFCGTAGTGKTHLAVGIAKQVIAAGFSATFQTAMNAIRSVRETYRKNSELTERQVIQRFAIADLTIIDEVGSQLGTDAEKVTLFDLINARYENLKPMILISNLTIREVENYLGARVFDRLRENGGQAVAFTWQSYRRNTQ